MATSNKTDFLLSYAGIPFVLDEGRVFRLPATGGHETEPVAQIPPSDQQPLADLIDEIDRLISFDYLQDFSLPDVHPGRSLSAIARRELAYGYPSPQIHIGDWYYPTTVSRWSVFRGLMTSSQIRAVLDITQGYKNDTFIMKALPQGAVMSRPNLAQDTVLDQRMAGKAYELETDMFMLPPRPLAEHSSKYDGLFLVTLVDERWYFQFASVSLQVKQDTTWQNLIDRCAAALGITIQPIDVPEVYSQPEPDSQLWTQEESAAVLLDAIAANVGDTIIRLLQPTPGGQYRFDPPLESQTIAKRNRGDAFKLTATGAYEPGRDVVRVAGGTIFQSGTAFASKDLTKFRNAVLPASVDVTFPRYVRDNDPVPHFVNKRYENQRPSCWFEDGYGDKYVVSVPIKSGGSVFAANPFLSDEYPLSGMVGNEDYKYTINCTAKALISGEIQVGNATDPLNASGLTSLAMQLAADYYNWQGSCGYDEVYPGTYNWTPEGYHDIIWTYSARQRGGFTRVMRTYWNQTISEMQHAAHAMSGYTNTPAGVGGPSVAQTWRDSFSGSISKVGGINTTLESPMLEEDLSATFASINHFPTDHRWRGIVSSGGPDQEIILFEGTSGLTTGIVNVVYRGIDGSIQQAHLIGAPVAQVLPNAAYGVNLVNHGLMQWIFPSEWTSGGIQGARVVPQTQSIKALDDAGVSINGKTHYSGQIQSYAAPQTAFVPEAFCWLVERNEQGITNARNYDGQFAGYSAAVAGKTGVAPVYLVNESVAGDGGFPAKITGGVACGPGVTNPFSIVEQRPLVNGGWENLPGGRTSDNAYHANKINYSPNGPILQIGTIVLHVKKSFAGPPQEYTFDCPAGWTGTRRYLDSVVCCADGSLRQLFYFDVFWNGSLVKLPCHIDQPICTATCDPPASPCP